MSRRSKKPTSISNSGSKQSLKKTRPPNIKNKKAHDPPPKKSSSKPTQLSNPFSTGGGGHNFENHIQAAFVVLMLSGGTVPCVRPWPIKSIKLQGHYANYHTDDFIAFLEERGGSGKAKLLAQIKHSLTFTESDETFSKVIQSAWLDYSHPEFDPNSDAIALITGPLSALDIENVRRILEWARTSANPEEFFTKINRVKFSSKAKRDKLLAFRAHLKRANRGNDIGDRSLWRFLKCYHILGYDLDIQSGVTTSLLNSHIAQFNTDNIYGIWAMVAKEVETFNQNAGTITYDSLSEEIRSSFSSRVRSEIPEDFLQPLQETVPATGDTYKGEYAEALAIASLLGKWNESVEADKTAIRQLLNHHD